MHKVSFKSICPVLKIQLKINNRVCGPDCEETLKPENRKIHIEFLKRFLIVIQRKMKHPQHILKSHSVLMISTFHHKTDSETNQLKIVSVKETM